MYLYTEGRIPEENGKQWNEGKKEIIEGKNDHDRLFKSFFSSYNVTFTPYNVIDKDISDCGN